ncbi:glycosyltransferase family 4 protein [Microvirga tunisiensis]|uniref:Glycosyltransferase family 4 protein n=1 Tax=Microvirga tunisiensis TaxID=2108360 RepID=A0A5N7MIZ9_9HYPH|nr:glycosyltransferase family 4 protein [Microvirga tunisiensis]MPR08712.1 glycosyltransferase family 4 protein [Microvirga tunisiensis]MPR26917.1 glycosyltransferase family 4 protein [Microvirga tunisiensis]
MTYMYGLLHRGWQLLPHSLRRKAFNEISLRLAPRLDPAANCRNAPWIIVGALSASTGLGEAARLAVDALLAAGERVSSIDLTSALQHELSVPVRELARPQEGSGTILVFLNPPVSAMALRLIPERLLAGKHRIGCWVWEFEEAPSNWRAHAELFHKIVAPSRFAAAGIAKSIGQSVGLLPHPVAVSPIEIAQPGDRPFTVGIVGDVVAAADRKNALAAVQAFIHSGLKAGDARLVIHLHGQSPNAQPVQTLVDHARQSGFDIVISTGVRARSDTRLFYAGLDLYLSLHRAEGFGLTVAEAMLAGVPVVSTNWSATAEFVDHLVGYPVPYELVPSSGTVDDRRPHRWADPDIHAAAECIRAAFHDKAARQQRGRVARDRAEKLFSASEFMNWLQPNHD